MFSLFLALPVRLVQYGVSARAHRFSLQLVCFVSCSCLLSDLVLEDARSSHWSVLCLMDVPRYKAAHIEFRYIFYLLCLLIHEKNKTRKKANKN